MKKIEHSNTPFRFLITDGYANFKMPIPGMFISFCPFCGQNLYKFYAKDEYANEIEGETFSIIK